MLKKIEGDEKNIKELKERNELDIQDEFIVVRGQIMSNFEYFYSVLTRLLRSFYFIQSGKKKVGQHRTH